MTEGNNELCFGDIVEGIVQTPNGLKAFTYVVINVGKESTYYAHLVERVGHDPDAPEIIVSAPGTCGVKNLVRKVGHWEKEKVVEESLQFFKRIWNLPDEETETMRKMIGAGAEPYSRPLP